MKLSDFDYNLPKELIAQHPLPERGSSRLLVLRKDTGALEHRAFRDFPSLLAKGDILVMNDTKVCNARLFGKRQGHEGKIEILLVERLDDNLYTALVKPARKFKDGVELIFGREKLKATVVGVKDEFKLIKFHTDGDLSKILDDIGEMPLPPYIKRIPDSHDKQSYQTVYAKNLGAIAAPTAGLHFTKEIINEIKRNEVSVAHVTLHVGYATFKPVKEDEIENHNMHSERFEIDKTAADSINIAKKNNNRVIAVGTTSCRVLESTAFKRNTLPTGRQAEYEIRNTAACTDLFIYPGFKFQATDALLTNFHLPRTTLFMLVCAFAGRENILRAYDEAIKEKYRFFSYGDAMLII